MRDGSSAQFKGKSLMQGSTNTTSSHRDSPDLILVVTAFLDARISGSATVR